MVVAKQRGPIRRRGYRVATLTDARGRPLAYVDRLAAYPDASGGGALGLSGVAFAPSVFERLGRARLRPVCILTGGVVRLTVEGLRLTFHAGERPSADGGWYCDAAVGTFRMIQRGARHPGRPRRTR